MKSTRSLVRLMTMLDAMRTVIEIIENKPIAPKTKLSGLELKTK